MGREENLDSHVVPAKEFDRLAARVVEPGEIVHLAVDGHVALRHEKGETNHKQSGDFH